MKLQLTAVRIAVAPVDMRLGADGLSLLVQQSLGVAHCDVTAYLFSKGRRNRLKLVCWDGNGVWMRQRRLHRGHFFSPRAGDAVCKLSEEQCQWLVAGVDWQCRHRRRLPGSCEGSDARARNDRLGLLTWRRPC